VSRPLPPACGRGCPDGDYWRGEALAARALAARAAAGGQLIPGPCGPCLDGCPVIGGPCTVGRPGVGGPCPDVEVDALYPGRLATPAMSVAERLVGLALVGPWLVCTAGWAFGVAAHRLVRAVLR
jgi:hypothetical protein